MSEELAKLYDPAAIEPTISARWLAAKAFAATPDQRDNRYVVMMPLPNVTGALHMGHAIDNVMQDLLIRWHRMLGDNTLWMAGTDHAGIATQAVVETRLKKLEGKTRHDLGRDALVARIWAWKDEYQQRIVRQQQAMGCSCDWDRQRFTMDEVCARAVRHTFFSMFRDGLIYKGARMVNWDCELRTAVSDDELKRETVQAHFYHLRYPVIDPAPGEPTHITVATTRPETMLGDTAVACHPDPAGELRRLITKAEEKLAAAPDKERGAVEAELAALRDRQASHEPLLTTIASMAAAGRQVLLPLQQRPIPILCDEWAKPGLGSGCVKITPAHDPNDYEVWQRHKERIGCITVLAEDGTVNDAGGAYAGMDRFAARQKVVADLQAAGLVERIEDREIEIEHSDRSGTIIEPLISRQWFVRMGDLDGGVTLGRGTPNEFTAPGLAQAAIDATDPQWHSNTGRNLTFHPDSERYGGLYRSWLGEKRDWCISRQLWWGHRIPVWTGTWTAQQLAAMEALLRQHQQRDDVWAWIVLPDDRCLTPTNALELLGRGELPPDTRLELQLCFRDKGSEDAVAGLLGSVGLTADEDVLDTWFSSALWPHSTLGWPDPSNAPILPGQSSLTDALDYYYPGSCLVTARDIITLWVARMVIMGLYNLGDVPFVDCFIHANIQDGKGKKMSKSRGNGIDPVDIIEGYGADAMRYVMCELQTGTQDVRLPVHAVSPFTGKSIDLATAKHGSTVFTYLCPDTGKEFDVLGTMKDSGVPPAKLSSERFEIGRAFCNKLWNSARFALMNLGDVEFTPLGAEQLDISDRWILSRLGNAIAGVQQQLERYNPSAALSAVRDFFWNDFCDWYVELSKPRLRDPNAAAAARQVLAAVLDQTLRLCHPFVPFISEAIWERLGAQAPVRGIDRALPHSELLVHATWPTPTEAWQDAALEERFALIQDAVRKIREVRQSNGVPPSRPLDLQIRAGATTRAHLEAGRDHLVHLANAATIDFEPAGKPHAAATVMCADAEIHILDVIDVSKEIAKLQKQRAKLEGQLGALRKKLDNPGFLAKAPADVVERERGTLAQLEIDLSRTDESLQQLATE